MSVFTKSPFSLKQRARYIFDNILARGPIATIGWLAVISVILIFAAGAIIAAFKISPVDSAGLTLGEGIWESLMRTLDAGTMGGDTGWAFRTIMLIVTIGGIFIVSTLIGVLTAGLESKLEEMRKGRSTVVESNHILILGWSEKIFTIISELMIANASHKNTTIVILAPEDKIVMEDALRDRFGKKTAIKLVCRTGNPLDVGDIGITNPNEAKAIIVLSPEDESGDMYVIKALLALGNAPMGTHNQAPIVAEIRDRKNVEVARLASKNKAFFVVAPELIARITAQTCRQSGLSIVYTELLDFDGCEIYFYVEPQLTGKSFKESLFAFNTSTPIGLRHGNGTVTINPPAETILALDDTLILIADDDSAITYSPVSPTGQSLQTLITDTTARPEKILIIGWNKRGETILHELAQYVAPGSHTTIATSEQGSAGDIEQIENYSNLSRAVKITDTTNSAALVALHPEEFDHIIVLSETGKDIQAADAATLVTLLHLRNIAEKNNTTFSIVSEMLDVRNRSLAEVTKADDFIVSDSLISLMISQLAENPELNLVFEHLFSPEGSEIYLKPAEKYFTPGQATTFTTITQAAIARGEIAIGYRLAAQANDATRAYGIVVNPTKTTEVHFAAGDKIIVLAES